MPIAKKVFNNKNVSAFETQKLPSALHETRALKFIPLDYKGMHLQALKLITV